MKQNSYRTVVGIFDDYGKAEKVARDLEQTGIPRGAIEVRSNFMTDAAGRNQEHAPSHQGGVSGFFHRLFGGEETDTEQGHYAGAVRRGNAVVTVTAADNQIDETVRLMNSGGATDIDRHPEQHRRADGYERHDPKTPAYSYDQALKEGGPRRNMGENTSIPVLEEELQVGKKAVRRGGVRIYNRVVEQPVEEDIELREEHVRVERRAVDRPLENADAAKLSDRSIEVVEMAEEPVVRKRVRVREEVVVGKEATQRTEKIRDTVRRTEVEVEPLRADTDSPGNPIADHAADFRRDWQERYAGSGESYETYQPAYEYGYRTASDPRYKDRDWADIEATIRTDYRRANPNSSWDRAKGAVRYGWEMVTGNGSCCH